MSRRYSLDFFRLLAALGIIIIHVSYQSHSLLSSIGYRQWIITNAMGWFFIWGTPIFLMISGSLLLSSNTALSPGLFYKKRASKLLLPYLFWNLAYFFLKYHHFNLGLFLSEMLSNGTYYHLYFLNALVGLYLLTPLIRRYLPPSLLKYLVPLLLLLSAIYHFGTVFMGWYKVNRIVIWYLPYLGYYLAGWWLSHPINPKFIKLFLLVPIAISLISIYFSRRLVFAFSDYDQGRILVSRLSLTTMISSLCIFKLIYGLNITRPELQKKLLFLSDKSFGVYLIHPLVIFLLLQTSVIQYFQVAHYWLYLFLMILTTFFGSLILTSLIKKIPLLNRIV